MLSCRLLSRSFARLVAARFGHQGPWVPDLFARYWLCVNKQVSCEKRGCLLGLFARSVAARLENMADGHLASHEITLCVNKQCCYADCYGAFSRAIGLRVNNMVDVPLLIAPGNSVRE